MHQVIRTVVKAVNRLSAGRHAFTYTEIYISHWTCHVQHPDNAQEEPYL